MWPYLVKSCCMVKAKLNVLYYSRLRSWLIAVTVQVSEFCSSLISRLRKTAKTTNSFVMSVILSVYCRSAQNNSAPTGRIFMKFDIWLFSNICGDNSSLMKIWQEWQILYWKSYVHLWSYLAEFVLEWEIFQRELLEKIKRHNLGKSCRLWHSVEKYGGIRQATDDNIIWRMRFAC